MTQLSKTVVNSQRLSEETNWKRLERGRNTSLASSSLQSQWELEPGFFEAAGFSSQQDVFQLNGQLCEDIAQLPKLEGQVEEIFQSFEERTESFPANCDLLDIDYKEVTHSKCVDAVDESLEFQPEACDQKRKRRAKSENWVPSKNLISERRRRKKLNASLLKLRALIPNITKMDKASILADAVIHLQDLKNIVETLERQQERREEADIKSNSREEDKSSCGSLESRATGVGGALGRGNSLDESCATSASGENLEFMAVLDEMVQEIRLAVMKIEHGLYKLTIHCTRQTTVLLQLGEAIEAFVIEILHSSISTTTNGAICTFLVKMSSWNDMTMTAVRADFEELVGSFGFRVLHTSSCNN